MQRFDISMKVSKKNKVLDQKLKGFYITTSIAYVNAPPHLGFALEVIQADALARYHRIIDDDVFFLTGTDEHGAKVSKAAEEVGKTPREFCNEISGKFKALKKSFNLSNDDFIRTIDTKRHFPTVKKVWLKLREKGNIYKKKYKGLYCSGCEAFITKKDLVNGKCILHKREPEVIEEENYFFRLSRYSKKIEEILKKDIIKITPKVRKNEVLSFIKEGIADISFSRPRKNLKWGIPVPDDSTQTVYVWADALTNYISALDFASNGEKFKKYWPADVHFIGKDILRFHGLIWPAMLIALELDLPKTIFVHGFITVEGQKMSKSLGNIINPFGLVKKYGTDAVRYFLLREIPPSEDGDFTYGKFEERYNSDLAAGLGNLVARVITMAARANYKFKIQNSKQIPDLKFQTTIKKNWKNYKKSLDGFKFNEALISIWELISFCDRYIEKERPWEVKSQKAKIKSQKAIKNLLFSLVHITKMLQPFLPQTSEKILEQIETKKSKPLFPHIQSNAAPN